MGDNNEKSRAKRFAWVTGDVQISLCVRCKFKLEGAQCEVFPNGIPERILTGEYDHRIPYPGDGGQIFEPIE